MKYSTPGHKYELKTFDGGMPQCLTVDTLYATTNENA